MVCRFWRPFHCLNQLIRQIAIKDTSMKLTENTIFITGVGHGPLAMMQGKGRFRMALVTG